MDLGRRVGLVEGGGEASGGEVGEADEDGEEEEEAAAVVAVYSPVLCRLTVSLRFDMVERQRMRVDWLAPLSTTSAPSPSHRQRVSEARPPRQVTTWSLAGSKRGDETTEETSQQPLIPARQLPSGNVCVLNSGRRLEAQCRLPSCSSYEYVLGLRSQHTTRHPPVHRHYRILFHAEFIVYETPWFRAITLIIPSHHHSLTGSCSRIKSVCARGGHLCLL